MAVPLQSGQPLQADEPEGGVGSAGRHRRGRGEPGLAGRRYIPAALTIDSCASRRSRWNTAELTGPRPRPLTGAG